MIGFYRPARNTCLAANRVGVGSLGGGGSGAFNSFQRTEFSRSLWLRRILVLRGINNARSFVRIERFSDARIVNRRLLPRFCSSRFSVPAFGTFIVNSLSNIQLTNSCRCRRLGRGYHRRFYLSPRKCSCRRAPGWHRSICKSPNRSGADY